MRSTGLILFTVILNLASSEQGFVTLKRKRSQNQNCPSVTPPQGFYTMDADANIFENWPGALKANILITTISKVNQWEIHLKFAKQINLLQVPKAKFERVENNYFILRKMQWASNTLEKGERLKIEFIAYFAGRALPCITAIFAWKGDPGTPVTTPMSTIQPSTEELTSVQPSTEKPTTSQSSTNEVSTVPYSSIQPTLSQHIVTQNCSSVEANGSTGDQTTTIILRDDWPQGFKATIYTTVTENIANGWNIILSFSTDVTGLQVWKAIPNTKRGTRFVLKNWPWNRNLVNGTKLEVSFLAFKTTSLPNMCAQFVWRKNPITTSLPTGITSTSEPSSTTFPSTDKPTTVESSTKEATTASHSSFEPTTSEPTSKPTSYVSTAKVSTKASSTISSIFSTTPLLTKPNTTPATTAPLQTTRPISTTASSGTTQTVPNKNPYDYNEVLKKSILFYEAQRSGYLPATNRIPWRGDSATNDKGENGVDLVGGWYDAGDHVKFGFPMAFSTTLLTWGLLEYRDAYENGDQLQNMLSSIKWPLDYFLKAHVKPDVLYGQVGDAYLDHSYWGRPEFMTMKRPAYKVTKTAPGSDLAAETAAAMAAGSLAFRSTLPTYADNLLKHAKQLFSFADNYRGLYTQSISNARQFYNSVSYKDELVWGALWLYKATNDKSYLTKAEKYFKDFGLSNPGWAFSWDEKIGGLQLMLYQLTKKQVYQDAVQRTLNTWLPGGGITYTPKGLAWRLKWGPNRYAANTAFLALVAADNGLKNKAYRDFGRKQIHYMLGDSGRSYVVGFGKNPPVNPHHRASSCAVTTKSCSINDPTPNPNILYGALVGGPDKDDKYKDQRQDYIMNEVATDYNAGFQSAVAALKSLEMKK